MIQYTEAQTQPCLGCTDDSCNCPGGQHNISIPSDLVSSSYEDTFRQTMIFDHSLSEQEIEENMLQWEQDTFNAIKAPISEWAKVDNIIKNFHVAE